MEQPTSSLAILLERQAKIYLKVDIIVNTILGGGYK